MFDRQKAWRRLGDVTIQKLNGHLTDLILVTSRSTPCASGSSSLSENEKDRLMEFEGSFFEFYGVRGTVF